VHVYLCHFIVIGSIYVFSNCPLIFSTILQGQAKLEFSVTDVTLAQPPPLITHLHTAVVKVSLCSAFKDIFSRLYLPIVIFIAYGYLGSCVYFNLSTPDMFLYPLFITVLFHAVCEPYPSLYILCACFVTSPFQVIAGRHLPAGDSNGFSNPYIILELVDADTGHSLNPPRKHTTKTCYKTLNPQWNETFSWHDLEEDVGSLLVKVIINTHPGVCMCVFVCQGLRLLLLYWRRRLLARIWFVSLC